MAFEISSCILRNCLQNCWFKADVDIQTNEEKLWLDSGIIDDGMQVQFMSRASVSFVTSNVYLLVFKETAIDNVETSLTMQVPYAL